MTERVIHVEGLGKRYRVGERERYFALARCDRARHYARLFGVMAARRRVDYLWALRDVSFDVKPGRGRRTHRTQWSREDYAAETALAHNPAHNWIR